MSFTDLLTIAMPVYERKEYFLEALDSALNQTVKCEVIVVDNCSSHDYFSKTCKEKGVTYYRNDKNVGLFPNFNRCFELAETEYVMTLQDDDIMSLDYVESFLYAITQHPDVDVFFTNFIKNYHYTGEKLPHKYTFPYGYMNTGDKVIEYGIKYKLGFPVIASAIRKSKFSGYYSDFFSSNDWLWLYSNADQLAFFGDERVLYEFREHEEQNTQKNLSNLYLSQPYFYEKVLQKRANSPQLKRLANKRALAALFVFKSMANKTMVNQFILSDSIYGNYLEAKLETDWRIRLLFGLPTVLVDFVYRALRRVKIVS